MLIRLTHADPRARIVSMVHTKWNDGPKEFVTIQFPHQTDVMIAGFTMEEYINAWRELRKQINP